jgi:hypothetical protein
MVHFLYGKTSNWTELKSEEVPLIVIEQFADKFTNKSPEKWYRLGKNHFAVSFQRNGSTNLAVFSSAGILQNEEYNFHEDDYYENYDDYWDYDLYD